MGKGGGNVHPRGVGAGGTTGASGAAAGTLRRPQSSPTGAPSDFMRRILTPPTGTVGLVDGTAEASGGGGGREDHTQVNGPTGTAADTDTIGSRPNGGGGSVGDVADQNEERQNRGRKRSRRSFDGKSGDGEDDKEGEDEDGNVAFSINDSDDTGANDACETSSEDKAYGYVMLDECSVLIDESSTNGDGDAIVTRRWIDIEVTNQKDTKEMEERMEMEDVIDDASHPRNCHRSDLVLQTQSSSSGGGGLTMDSNSVARFDGTLMDAKSTPPSSSASASASIKNADYANDGNRSDAALMLGMVLGCQDMGLVDITRCRIALHGQENTKSSGDANASSDVTATAAQCRYRASIVVILAVNMDAIRSFAPSGKSYAKQPAKKRARRSSSSKSSSSRSRRKCRGRGELPSPMQLLLSMMRCDWARMNVHMETKLLGAKRIIGDCEDEDESGGGQRRKANIFPKAITLDELYQRITGASTHTIDADDSSQKNAVLKQACGPVINDDIRRPFSSHAGLPDEIIVRVSKFLRAESLYNFRCASLRLHTMLRVVVPGLKLRLFNHQINSLDWMRKREIKGLTEADTLHDHATGLGAEDALVGGDFHRAASGGASILLTHCDGSGTENGVSSKTIRIDGKSGELLDSSSMSHIGRLRKFARGGMLCDDPGLGKTITVMSIILQTFGLSTKKEELTNDSNAFSKENEDDEIFRSYWREGVTDFGRTPQLLRLVNELRRCDKESIYFEMPIDPKADGAEDYYDVVATPICMADILEKINTHNYGHDFEGMCTDVQLVFRNAMLYNPPDHHVYKAAKRLSDKFKELIRTFKESQTKSAKKAYGSITSKPDSSVAAILAERANAELIDSLYPSSGNLLIVPNTLLKHWENQISMHVDFGYLTKRLPLIYRLSKKGKASHSVDEVIRLCQQEKTHSPVLFIDEGTSTPLPPPSFLAMFYIVLTTNQRIQSEWKFGSVEEEIKISSRGSGRQTNYRAFYDDIVADTPPPSPLLKVHWLRLVVDEGHVMGRGSNTNTIQFASWITAQRRWAMTGTPTQQTANQSGLRNLLGLVKFLKHDFFSARLGGDHVWNELIARTWNEGNLSSFFRLRMLLSLLMVRHTKADIQEVPEPKYIKSRTCMSVEELRSYNTLVSAAQMNIVTTSMEGKTSGWQDSLLNPRQTKHARKALDNIRLACCGGAHVLPRLEDQLWVETIQYLRVLHGLDDIKVAIVDNYLKRATTGELSSCMCCGLQLQTLFVVPCGCLICTECIDNKTTTCPNCEKPFDIDDFQRLQPGLIYEWSLAIKEEKEKRERDEALRRELTEVHSIAQGGLNGLGANGGTGTGAEPAAALAGGNNAGPIDLIGNNGAANGEGSPSRASRNRRAKNHVCTFSRTVCDGKCVSCREEHFDCNFLLDRDQCSLCFKKSEDCPPEASKALFVTNKLLRLREKEISGIRVFQRPLKVIIFSQFRLSLDYAGDRLIRRFGGSAVAEYWGSTRGKELEKFISSPSCFCMLLGKEGSHGLDLSFVTNIILLDEMYDRSLQEQVVARAYRMGATGRVEVEQLIAENSIEELMESINEGGKLPDANDFKAGARGATTKKKGNDTTDSNQNAPQPKTSHAKIHYLLKNVRLARGLEGAGETSKLKPRRGDKKQKEDDERKMPAWSVDGIGSGSDGRSQARVRFGEPTVHSFE